MVLALEEEEVELVSSVELFNWSKSVGFGFKSDVADFGSLVTEGRLLAG